MSEHRSGFVAIVGPANAGKSTLLNAILKKKVSIVSPKPQTTRNRVLGIKDGKDYQIVFLDTPGFFDAKMLRRGKGKALGDFLRKQVNEALKGIDVTLLVVDGSRCIREEGHLEEVVLTFRKFFRVAPDFVAINKIDLIDKNALLPLLKRIYDQFQSDATPARDMELIPVSAGTSDGLVQLEELLLKKLPLGVQYFPEGQLTDQSDETLAAEIIREKLFHQLNDELPYSVAVHVENWSDDANLTRISAVVAVERESQKAIVIGAKGAKLKAIGTAARKELERIYGTKIFLELFVRVEEHWTKTERGLRRVGMH